MNEPKGRQEMQDAIEGDRRRILELLSEHNKLPSSEIRDRIDIPQGSKHYQLSLLESWNLIEEVDTIHLGEQKTGNPATVYALTTTGQRLIADIEAAPAVEKDVDDE